MRMRHEKTFEWYILLVHKSPETSQVNVTNLCSKQFWNIQQSTETLCYVHSQSTINSNYLKIHVHQSRFSGFWHWIGWLVIFTAFYTNHIVELHSCGVNLTLNNSVIRKQCGHSRVKTDFIFTYTSNLNAHEYKNQSAGKYFFLSYK